VQSGSFLIGKKLTQEQSLALLDSMLLLMQQMRTESSNGLRHAHELAMQEGLTVYDASYLAVAVKSNLVLVTDGLS